MKSIALVACGATAIALLSGCGPTAGAEPPAMSPAMGAQQPAMAGQQQAAAVIRAWPEESREVANEAIRKYGQPQEVASGRLVWHNAGDWKRVVVYQEVVQHNFPMPHPDVMEGFIDYRVPPEMADVLAQFTGSLYLDRTKGEMSARCDKEGANFLSINLAHDIINGRRTVEQARQFYGEAVAASMRGEVHPYMQRFQFQLPRGGTADPDRPVM